MKKHHPEFKYKWTALGKESGKAEYGDNGLIISGIKNDGAREELAQGIMQLQKKIDKNSKEQQK